MIQYLKYLVLLVLVVILSVGCGGDNDCEIGEIEVGVGDCTSDGTYVLEIDFEVENADNEFFDLFVRGGELIDFYRIDALPLRLEDFELSGRDYDFIKVCINDNPDCCREVEFLPPTCSGADDCEIGEIAIGVGDCTTEETYVVELDFEFEGVTNALFDLKVRNED